MPIYINNHSLSDMSNYKNAKNPGAPEIGNSDFSPMKVAQTSFDQAASERNTRAEMIQEVINSSLDEVQSILRQRMFMLVKAGMNSEAKIFQKYEKKISEIAQRLEEGAVVAEETSPSTRSSSQGPVVTEETLPLIRLQRSTSEIQLSSSGEALKTRQNCRELEKDEIAKQGTVKKRKTLNRKREKAVGFREFRCDDEISKRNLREATNMTIEAQIRRLLELDNSVHTK